MASNKVRTFYLLDIFEKYTDSAHRLSADDLAAKITQEYDIAVERKSIYRDIEVLTEYGADIVRSTTGYYLRNRKFKLPELRLLISAVQAATFIPQNKSLQLINALCDIPSVYQAETLNAQANIGVSKHKNDEIYRTIDLINTAIAKRRQISFFYYKKDVDKNDVLQHNGERYFVSPYAMIWSKDKYYLVSNIDKYNNLSHFRLDRIRDAQTENTRWRHFSEVSPYNDTFDATNYVTKRMNMYGGDVARITLCCNNSLTSEIFDLFGDEVIMTPKSDTHFTAIVDVAISQGLIAWLGQFLDEVEVVSPPSLRKAMKNRLEKAMLLYND